METWNIPRFTERQRYMYIVLVISYFASRCVFLISSWLKWSYVLGSVLSIEQRRFFAVSYQEIMWLYNECKSPKSHVCLSMRTCFFSVVWVCNGCLDTRSHNVFPNGSTECRLWKGPIHGIYVPFISVIVHNLYRLKILHSFVEHQVLLYTSPWISFSTIVFLTEPEENQTSPTCDKTRPIIAGMYTAAQSHCWETQRAGKWHTFIVFQVACQQCSLGDLGSNEVICTLHM